MRRHWVSVLLFALALAVSAFAPAGANVALALGGGEIRASGEFCLGHGDGDQPRQPSGHGERRHDSCPLCQVCCDNVAPVATKPVQLGMAPVQWAKFAWTEADRALPSPRGEYSHRARAPPSFS